MSNGPSLGAQPAGGAPACVLGCAPRPRQMLARACAGTSACRDSRPALRPPTHSIVCSFTRMFIAPQPQHSSVAVHFEDQLSSEKKCGHLGGKVLVPTQSAVRNLIAGECPTVASLPKRGLLATYQGLHMDRKHLLCRFTSPSSHSPPPHTLPLLTLSPSSHSPPPHTLPLLTLSPSSHSPPPHTLPLLTLSPSSHSPPPHILPLLTLSPSSHSPPPHTLPLLTLSPSSHSPPPHTLPLLTLSPSSHSPPPHTLPLLTLSPSSHSPPPRPSLLHLPPPSSSPIAPLSLPPPRPSHPPLPLPLSPPQPAWRLTWRGFPLCLLRAPTPTAPTC